MCGRTRTGLEKHTHMRMQKDLSLSLSTHAHTHARTNARTHTRTHARTHKERQGAERGSGGGRLGEAAVVGKGSQGYEQMGRPKQARYSITRMEVHGVHDDEASVGRVGAR